MATAIVCPYDTYFVIDFDPPVGADLRGLNRYTRADIYLTQDILDAWQTANRYGAVVWTSSPDSGSSSGWPFVYTWDIDNNETWDDWTDGWGGVGVPILNCCFTEGWHTFEFFAASSGGTNRFAVDGTEVTWASTYVINQGFWDLGNSSPPQAADANDIYVGLIEIGTAWQTADLLSIDGTAITQGEFDQLVSDGRIFLPFGDPDAYIGAAPDVPDPEPPPADETRFDYSPPWRYLVTDLESESITLLDHLAKNRRITFTLNQPCVMEGTAPSDNPEVNIPVAGEPYLQEGNRLLYCFRRDGAGGSTQPWTIRAAGIILDVNDRGDPNSAFSDFVAFDPWQLLYKRPTLEDEYGTLPEDGLTYLSSPGSGIALELLERTAAANGETHIDFVSGTIEETDALTIDFQPGTSVGEAWDQLVATGTMDIVLDPVYDPIVRPGIVAELNIYDRAGSARRNAIFAWDKPGRSAIDLGRQRDGRERVNKAQYYIGQGGPPVTLVTNAGSVTEFGQYWEQQFFPSHEQSAAVLAIAQAQVRLRANGLVTYTLSPAPERSPDPLTGYYLGDRVPIYASRNLREAVAVVKRVYSIPLVIGDDQMEAVVGLLFADDEQDVEEEGT